MQYSKDEIERVLISNEEIQKRLDELAAQVNADYAGKDLLMVCILKGAVTVFADMLRRIEIPCAIDFMAIPPNPPAWCASSRIWTTVSRARMC